MTIDMSKKYLTRDGRKVRIYAVDAGGDYPVHGAILKAGTDGDWTAETWAGGDYLFSSRADAAPHHGDLVEVKAEVWVWQFEDGSVSADNKLTPAECAAVPGRTKGKPVRFVQEDEA
jgi:hypothetical protein